MARIEKHIFVAKNMELIKRLIKSGDLSHKIINDYNIYVFFKAQKGMKMQRYQDAAHYAKVSTLTVMYAVKSMESKM